MSHLNHVAIFWDFENCRPSANTPGYDVVERIRRLVQSRGSITVFRAYFEITVEGMSTKASTLQSELQSSGVSLTHCPHNGKKDVADKMMLVDMLAFAIDKPAPATVVLITGDRDFAYAISVLKLRGYEVVLIAPSTNAHASLTVQASEVYDWQRDVMGPSNNRLSSMANPSDLSLNELMASMPIRNTSTPNRLRPPNSANRVLYNFFPQEADPQLVGGWYSGLPASSASWMPATPGSSRFPQKNIPELSPVKTWSNLARNMLTSPAHGRNDLPVVEDVRNAQSSRQTKRPLPTPLHTNIASLPTPSGLPSSDESVFSCFKEEDSSSKDSSELLSGSTLSSSDSLRKDVSTPTSPARRVSSPSKGILKDITRGPPSPGKRPVHFRTNPNSFLPIDESPRATKTEFVVEGPPILSKSLPSIPLQSNALDISIDAGSRTATPISTASTAKLVNNSADPRFQPIVDYFRQRKAEGRSTCVPSSELASDLRKKDPRIYEKAGVAKFKAYLEEAKKAGVVDTPGLDAQGTATVSLNERLYKDDIFEPLINVILRLDSGTRRVLFSRLGDVLLKQYPLVYLKAGVAGLSGYLEKAETAGIAKIGGRNSPGQQWVELIGRWSNRP